MGKNLSKDLLIPGLLSSSSRFLALCRPYDELINFLLCQHIQNLHHVSSVLCMFLLKFELELHFST